MSGVDGDGDADAGGRGGRSTALGDRVDRDGGETDEDEDEDMGVDGTDARDGSVECEARDDGVLGPGLGAVRVELPLTRIASLGCDDEQEASDASTTRAARPRPFARA